MLHRPLGQPPKPPTSRKAELRRARDCPEDLADALRMTLRQEVADLEQVEVEFERVMALVRADASAGW